MSRPDPRPSRPSRDEERKVIEREKKLTAQQAKRIEALDAQLQIIRRRKREGQVHGG